MLTSPSSALLRSSRATCSKSWGLSPGSALPMALASLPSRRWANSSLSNRMCFSHASASAVFMARLLPLVHPRHLLAPDALFPYPGFRLLAMSLPSPGPSHSSNFTKPPRRCLLGNSVDRVEKKEGHYANPHRAAAILKTCTSAGDPVTFGRRSIVIVSKERQYLLLADEDLISLTAGGDAHAFA